MGTVRELLLQRAEAAKRRTACRLCQFLERQSPEERAEWEEVLAEPIAIIPHTVISEALREDFGVDIGEQAVGRHRRNHV